jgi:HSP20 family protein
MSKDTSNQNENENRIDIRRPTDIFEVFDDIWSDFRRDFISPRKRKSGEISPWWRKELSERREACTDLLDEGAQYKICAEIPGVPKEKIEINVSEKDIEISASSETGRRQEQEDYLVNERSYSEIYRRITFPEETIPENAEASLVNGVLEVTVPKKNPKRTSKHKVEIK